MKNTTDNCASFNNEIKNIDNIPTVADKNLV